MWFSASLSVSPSAMLWWSLLQFMKAMIRVRSASVKPSALLEEALASPRRRGC